MLGYGLGFLVMFVTWLIVLIAGRMPRPLHEAIAAAVRYHVRVTGYFLMLTGRYPGGLFGDPATSAFVAAPAGGGFPAGPADPARRRPRAGGACSGPAWVRSARVRRPAGGAFDYGTPVAPGQPAPDSTGEPGYGQPPPGYGQPGPGQRAAPVAGLAATSPGGWSCPAAKRLVTVFLVLGVVLAVGYVVLISVVAATSGNDSVTQAEATISVEGSFATLSTALSSFDSKVTACQGKLSCVNQADAEMSRAFGTFAQEMGGKSMPDAASTAAADRVRSDASGRQRLRAARRGDVAGAVPAGRGQHRAGVPARPLRRGLPDPRRRPRRPLTLRRPPSPRRRRVGAASRTYNVMEAAPARWPHQPAGPAAGGSLTGCLSLGVG